MALKSHHAGTYACEASNGIGKPIKKIIKVHVNGERFIKKFTISLKIYKSKTMDVFNLYIFTLSLNFL